MRPPKIDPPAAWPALLADAVATPGVISDAYRRFWNYSAGNQLDDGEGTPKNLREVEAEAVALICCESLGLAGAEFCRGYLQHWLQGDVIPERSAHRVFKAADGVLRAGRPAAAAAPAVPEGRP